jgi:RNA-directed DNA polymerase
MAVAPGSTGASSHDLSEWHTINWQAVHQEVRRLQARIVKATQAGKWGKVRALQHLLTHSFSGKALAVRRVTENQGQRTPGVDGETWNTPEKKAAAVHSLRQRGYRPQPLKRVYLPKSNGKLRPLGIPVMKCRAMQALYLLGLDPVAETLADRNSYGFRTGRSTADAMEKIFLQLSRKHSPSWILEGDIRGCFDRISHNWLLAHIPMDKSMLRKWLKAGFMEKHVLNPTEEGTPQGGIVSPVLANLTLDGLEQALKDYIRPTTRRGQKAKVHLIRYADDFIITASSKELLADEIKPLVARFLQERGLELSQEKTAVTPIENGFDFLGQRVRKYGGVLLIQPSKKNVQTHLKKIRGIIKDNKQTQAGTLIATLNPVIRGWANYHRHMASKRVFTKVDSAIYEQLWQWAKRRHPNKDKWWIKDRYFHTVGEQHWVFSGEVEGKKGETQTIHLCKTAKTKIQRHVVIQGEANPYDPAWEEYFDQRLGLKWLQGANRNRLVTLWIQQMGKCPLCHQNITKETGWNIHHILYRVYGGTDCLENLLVLHPNCHSQVHSQGLTVVKPGTATCLGEA